MWGCMTGDAYMINGSDDDDDNDSDGMDGEEV